MCSLTHLKGSRPIRNTEWSPTALAHSAEVASASAEASAFAKATVDKSAVPRAVAIAALARRRPEPCDGGPATKAGQPWVVIGFRSSVGRNAKLLAYVLAKGISDFGVARNWCSSYSIRASIEIVVGPSTAEGTAFG